MFIIPEDLPTKLPYAAAWLDGFDKNVIKLSGGTLTWHDKFGKGRSASQGTAAKQPTSGALTQNGRNVLSYDGGDVLSMSAAWLTLGSTNATIFIVAKDNVNASNSSFMRMSKTGSTYFSIGTTTTPGTVIFNWTSGGVSTPGQATTYCNIYTAYRQGVNKGIAVNNSSFTILGGCVDFVADAGAIGAGSTTPINPLNGFIAEVIVYAGNLSETERSVVYNYLKTKWGL